MPIITSIILIALACWLVSWLLVGVGMAVVKLTDFITSLFKGKWQ